MSQHHFIIKYDTNTERWTWDTDQEERRFKGGSILLPDGSWVNSSDSPVINEIDESASNVLNAMLGLANHLSSNSLDMKVVGEQ